MRTIRTLAALFAMGAAVWLVVSVLDAIPPPHKDVGPLLLFVAAG